MRILGTVASSSREVPGAPTIGTATNVGSGRAYNNGRADVTFTAPAVDGGFPILDYTVTSSPGGYTTTGASSPLTVTGLQSGVAYTFTVTARTAIGTGPASAASNSITATTVPQAPTIGTATRTNNTTVSLGFTAGATGGSTITSYTATSSPSISLTTSGTSSPLTITGSYATGQGYTFTIVATNANGTSTSSGSSNSVTPASIPVLGAWSAGSTYPLTAQWVTGTSNGTTINSFGGQTGGSTYTSNGYYGTLGSLSATNYNLGQNFLSSITYTDDGYVWGAGGLNSEGIEFQDCAYKTSASGAWTTATSMPNPNAGGAYGSLGNTQIYGPGNNTQSTIFYRTGAGAWTTTGTIYASYASGGIMVRNTFGGTTKLYAGNTGGQVTWWSSTSAGGTWTSEANWPAAKNSGSAWVSYNGYVFGTMGGTNGDTYRFNNNGTFTQQTALNITRQQNRAFGLVGNQFQTWTGNVSGSRSNTSSVATIS